jgi:hypothetical protein
MVFSACPGCSWFLCQSWLQLGFFAVLVTGGFLCLSLLQQGFSTCPDCRLGFSACPGCSWVSLPVLVAAGLGFSSCRGLYVGFSASPCCSWVSLPVVGYMWVSLPVLVAGRFICLSWLQVGFSACPGCSSFFLYLPDSTCATINLSRQAISPTYLGSLYISFTCPGHIFI